MKSISLVALAGLTALWSCDAGVPGDRNGSTLPDDAARRRAASPVQEVWTSPPEAELTSFSQVAVDSRGSVYVPDFYRNRVVVIAPEGRVVRTVGRAGSGPGEFQAIRTVQVLRGDSLLVYDGGLGRVNVFAPGSDREVYVVTVPGAAPWALERTHANDAYLARYDPGFQFGQGAEAGPREDRIRVLNLDGSERARPLSFPAAAASRRARRQSGAAPTLTQARQRGGRTMRARTSRGALRGRGCVAKAGRVHPSRRRVGGITVPSSTGLALSDEFSDIEGRVGCAGDARRIVKIRPSRGTDRGSIASLSRSNAWASSRSRSRT